MNGTNKTFNGTRHAEFVGVDDILSGGRYGPEVLKKCDLYVTVEPCIMCASFLRQTGVRRVFFGAGNEKFGGCGGVLEVQNENGRWREGEGVGEGKGGEEERWKEGDYEVSGGWMREEAIMLLRRFYVGENERAPEERRRGKEGKRLERVLKEL